MVYGWYFCHAGVVNQLQTGRAPPCRDSFLKMRNHGRTWRVPYVSTCFNRSILRYALVIKCGNGKSPSKMKVLFSNGKTSINKMSFPPTFDCQSLWKVSNGAPHHIPALRVSSYRFNLSCSAEFEAAMYVSRFNCTKIWTDLRKRSRNP